jgi:hypothetical protein
MAKLSRILSNSIISWSMSVMMTFGIALNLGHFEHVIVSEVGSMHKILRVPGHSLLCMFAHGYFIHASLVTENSFYLWTFV